MVDETTDISNKEQVVVAHEEFIGLYQIESTQSEMLLTVVHDVLHRLNISRSKLVVNVMMVLLQCVDLKEG